MIVNPITTQKITAGSHTIYDIIDKAVDILTEQSILVITSKIIALCEGRVVRIGDADKTDLIKQESQYYIPPDMNPHAITLTITNNLLVPTAGIDESNGNGYYVLWPKNPQQTAWKIRTYLTHKFRLTQLGILVTDSRTTPMRWGTTGIALSYAGFAGLNDYIGTPDLFGRSMEVTKANIADGLAAAAVVAMGESREQTPLARISEADFVHFDAHKPTKRELKEWQIPMETDLYGPLLKLAPWKKGRST